MTTAVSKIVTITKSEFSKLTNGAIGTSKQNLTTKFKKNGANYKFEVNFLDSKFWVEFDEKGNIILELSQYKKLEKISQKKLLEKTSVLEIVENMNTNLQSEIDILKNLTVESLDNSVKFFEHLNNKLILIQNFEKSIALISKRMEEMMIKMDSFYEEQEKYNADLKNIYQKNLNTVIGQTNLIIGATQVIIDKSNKQQNYEEDLRKHKEIITEYEEKLKRGIFSNIFSLKK